MISGEYVTKGGGVIEPGNFISFGLKERVWRSPMWMARLMCSGLLGIGIGGHHDLVPV